MDEIKELNDRLFQVQQQYIIDMRDFAHQFMKLSTDLINIQFGMQAPSSAPVSETGDEELEDIDPAMSGGSIGT